MLHILPQFQITVFDKYHTAILSVSFFDIGETTICKGASFRCTAAIKGQEQKKSAFVKGEVAAAVVDILVRTQFFLLSHHRQLWLLSDSTVKHSSTPGFRDRRQGVVNDNKRKKERCCACTSPECIPSCQRVHVGSTIHRADASNQPWKGQLPPQLQRYHHQQQS